MYQMIVFNKQKARFTTNNISKIKPENAITFSHNIKNTSET